MNKKNIGILIILGVVILGVVISMDSKKIGNGKPGDITKKMMQEYSDIVMNKNIDYAHWLTEVY